MRWGKQVKVRRLSDLTHKAAKALSDITYGESETSRSQVLRTGAEDTATTSSYWSVLEQSLPEYDIPQTYHPMG